MTPIRRLVSKQIGELLRESGIISEAQLNEALEAQKAKGGLIGEILVLLKYATEEQIAQALTIQYGFPYLPLDNYEIVKEIIDLVPVDVARSYGVIPIDKLGATMTVAMENPLNISAIEKLESITKCAIQPFVTTATSLKNALTKYYSKK